MDWKLISEIPGYEDFTNYELNITGDLRNRKTGRILKWVVISGGYLDINMTGDNGRKHITKHRALSHLFINNPDNLPVVDHMYGDKLDNEIGKLRWCTRQENQRNSKTPTTNYCGHKNICSTLQNGDPAWRIRLYIPDIEKGTKTKSCYIQRNTVDVPDHVIAKRDEMIKEHYGKFART